MPAALAIPAIIGAAGVGVQAVGAKKASDASKSAAQQQQQSVTQAQQFNREAFDRQSAALAPYQQAGQQALGNLMNRYGGSDPAAMAQRANAFTSSAQQGGPAFPSALSGYGGQSPMPQPGGQAGGMVLLSSPDGSMTKPVPAAMAQQFLAKGYRRAG